MVHAGLYQVMETHTLLVINTPWNSPYVTWPPSDPGSVYEFYLRYELLAHLRVSNISQCCTIQGTVRIFNNRTFTFESASYQHVRATCGDIGSARKDTLTEAF